MTDTTAVLRLVVALAATPPILFIAKRLEMPRVVLPFSIGYAAMVTAYAADTLGLFAPAAVLDPLRHLCYLASAAGMLGAALVIRSWAAERRRLRG